MNRVLSWIVLTLFAASVHARDLTVPLPEHGAITLSVPAGWNERVERRRVDLPPTITLVSADTSAFQVLITPIWRASTAVPRATKESVRESVRRAADRLQSQVLETQIPIVDFSGTSTFGSYFSVTDREPKPNEFRYMTQGTLALDDLRVTFTILVNGKPEAITEKALHIMKTMRREPTQASSGT